MGYWEDQLAASTQRIREADAEALKCQLAFASGHFDSYMQSKVDAAQKWIEDQYAELDDSGQAATPGDAEASGGGGSGTGSSGEGGGVTGSPPDAVGSSQETD